MLGDKSKPSKARCKARAICAAALPVGAANAIRGSFALLLQIRPKSFATVVVLPVPRPAGNQHKVLQQGQSRSIPLLFAIFSIKPVAQAF